VINHWNLLQLTADILQHPPDTTIQLSLDATACEALNPEEYKDRPRLQPSLQLQPEDFLSDSELAERLDPRHLSQGKFFV
jgi:hypothetical protein